MKHPIFFSLMLDCRCEIRPHIVQIIMPIFYGGTIERIYLYNIFLSNNFRFKWEAKPFLMRYRTKNK